MKSLRSLLVGATVVGLSPGVFAQADSGGNIEEVVVSGRRPLAESVAAALAVQRNSDSLVSVLSADAIGNLPDQNIAFAVGRLPGVAVERDQGQARYINLRDEAEDLVVAKSVDAMNETLETWRSLGGIVSGSVTTKILLQNISNDNAIDYRNGTRVVKDSAGAMNSSLVRMDMPQEVKDQLTNPNIAGDIITYKNNLISFDTVKQKFVHASIEALENAQSKPNYTKKNIKECDLPVGGNGGYQTSNSDSTVKSEYFFYDSNGKWKKYVATKTGTTTDNKGNEINLYTVEHFWLTP